MKYFYLLFIILTAIGCSSSKEKRPAQTILTPANLTKQVYEIDPAIENTIRTLNGATVRFPKDAFKLNGTGKVRVGIKEAYSIKDMLLGGLVTESNGKLLTSGGMIYLEARQNGKEIDLQKKAGVSIPASNYANGMQLYKGEYESDSSINWVQPKALDTTPAEYLQNGKAMFLANCSPCHGITKAAIGPALYDAVKRAPSKEWLYRYIRNWEDSFNHTDSTGKNYAMYSCCVRDYSPTVMNKFPQLTNYEIDMLFAYIQSVSDQNPTPAENPLAHCLPCLDVKMAEGKIPENWDSTFVKNYPQFYISPENPADTFIQETVLPANTPYDPADLEKGFRKGGFTDMPETNNYSFAIETLGWYNVDAEYAGLPGTEYCSLSLNINGEITESNLHAYLIVPTRKNLSVANNRNGDNWTFNKVDGKIPLHLNDQAYIITFGEENGNMVYGIKPFITQKENRLSITLSTITEEAFVAHIRKLGLEGLSFSVNKKTQHQDKDNKIIPEPVSTQPDGTQPLPADFKPERKNSAPAARADTTKYINYLDDDAFKQCPCGKGPVYKK